MKAKHVFIGLGIFFSSCSNTKSDLLDRQKLLYDSIKNIQARADIRTYQLDNGLNEDGDKLTRENGDDLTAAEIHRMALDDKLSGKWFRMVDSAHKLKKLYDSLELELKKD